jgi:type IV pilus assembly protein PilQ
MRWFFTLLTMVLSGSFASMVLAAPDKPARTSASGRDARASAIHRVVVHDLGSTAEMIVDGDFRMPLYTVRSKDQGSVVVLELDQVTLPPQGVQTLGKTSLVAHSSASTTAKGVRVELTLRKPVTYRARADAGRVRVMLEALDAPAKETANASHALPKDANVSGTAATAAATVSSAAKSTEPPAVGSVSVRHAHIERRDGRDRVVVHLSGPAEFRVVPGNKGAAKLEVLQSRLSSKAETKLQGASDSVIRSVQLRQADNATMIEVERVEGATTTAIREGDRIVWLFTPPASDDDKPKTKTVAREDYSALQQEESSVVAGFVDGSAAMQVKGKAVGRNYGGRRIDLDFKDADIHNILRLLSEVGGVNIITSDDVKGSVTIRMRDVPWDQALDMILQAKGLGMIRRGNLIRVAPIEALEKEREAAIARQKQNVELAPLETRLIPVSYATADNLKPRVGELISTRGTVSVDERTNVLIVRDIVDNLDDVEDLVRTLDTQTPQVLVEARIVEATTQYSRDIGIQWGGDLAMTSATGNPTGLTFPSNATFAGGNFNAASATAGLSPISAETATPNYAVNLPAAVGNGQGGAIGMSFGSVSGNFNLNVRLSAAEAQGTVRIISSPRILTLDNREAHIAQGTLIPYSQVSAQGVQTAFQEAKLQLIVKPHVTSDGSVAMHLKVTRDEPDFTRTSNRGDPTILKREAETDLLVADSHTAVIGGIFTRNQGRNIDQVPLFGDIPILGLLFQRRRVRDERNELLIFLTPRIVNRSAALQK